MYLLLPKNLPCFPLTGLNSGGCSANLWSSQKNNTSLNYWLDWSELSCQLPDRQTRWMLDLMSSARKQLGDCYSLFQKSVTTQLSLNYCFVLWQVTTWRGSGREQAKQEDEEILVSCLVQGEMNLLSKKVSQRLVFAVGEARQVNWATRKLHGQSSCSATFTPWFLWPKQFKWNKNTGEYTYILSITMK